MPDWTTYDSLEKNQDKLTLDADVTLQLKDSREAFFGNYYIYTYKLDEEDIKYFQEKLKRQKGE